LSTPPPEAAAETIVSPGVESLATSDPGEAQSSLIVEILRQEIATGERDLDAICGAIAKAAQALTRANATALAMRREGVVVCVGRSGDFAPEIGTQLSVDSGISGECLRTGRILRCDDTEKDFRADPEVCRRLGLRSIAAVPLRGRYGTMGVLEAFSSRVYAFAEEDMNALRDLAELAETARARRFSPVPPEEPPQFATWEPQPVIRHKSIAKTTRKAVLVLSDRMQSSGKILWVIGSACVIVLGLSIFGWEVWQASANEPINSSGPRASATQEVSDSSRPPEAVIEWKPSPLKSASSQRQISKPGVESAAVREREQSPREAHGLQSLSDTMNRSGEGSAPAPASQTPIAAPEIASNLGGRALLGSVLARPTEMPNFGTPVSSGVSGGNLLRKVAPGYPAQALAQRVEGSVVLQAMIAENGSVQELKVLSGHPLLAPAALDAVRRWKYQPYELNGKPIKRQTTITLTFKAP
jgi:TonB family protein